MFNYSITATKDGSTRRGTMAGTSPFASSPTGSTIPIAIFPLKITIGSSVFDPTEANACDGNISALNRFQQSPLLSPVTDLTFNGVNVGTTQYVNGFRRAEFWNQIGGSGAYQNTLTPTVGNTISLTVSSTYGILYSSGCSELGIVSNAWLTVMLERYVIPELQRDGLLKTTQFAAFLLKNVVQSGSTPPVVSNCCILGYHSAVGSPVQTYSAFEWDTSGLFSGNGDGSIASHEIAEFMDNPLGTNATPAWGNIGQVSGCERNLEVGDPLSGILMPAYTLNGATYHMQELGFFSWYFDSAGATSLGAGGEFSGNGTFSGPSKACSLGGRN
jgi:hypothetical protein